MEKTNTAQDASNLCQQCGLCCTGLLFEYVSFKEHELQNVDVGAYKMNKPGKRALTHPCQFLDGTSCGIYIDRPSKCRSFACISRQKVLNGTIALDEGNAVVAEIQGLLLQLASIGEETPGLDYQTIGFRKFVRSLRSLLIKSSTKGLCRQRQSKKLSACALKSSKLLIGIFAKPAA